MGDGWFILVLIVAGLAIAYFVWRQQQARREAMAALAHELGWVFLADGVRHDDADFFSKLMGLISSGESGAAYRGFAVFSQGRDRRAYNTMQGTIMLTVAGGEQRPCEALAGDFRYTTGSGKNQSTHHFSYLIVELPGGPVPETIIRPEGVFDQIAGFMGFDDIDFESAEFSKAFHVKGADKRFAYDLCDPRMMELLLMSRPRTIEMDRYHFCMADGRGRWSVDQFRHHIGWTVAFFDRWPRHLVDRLAPRPRAPLPPHAPHSSGMSHSHRTPSMDPYADVASGLWGRKR